MTAVALMRSPHPRRGEQRLPFEPLEELVRYRIIAAEPAVRPGHADTIGVPRIARRLAVHQRQVQRWRRIGVTADQAVELADRIRVPWINIWPELLDVFCGSTP